MLSPVTAHGGSAVWVTGPAGLDARALAAVLYQWGVVVEPGDVFYATARQHRNQLRIGYSSIATDRIDAGIRLLGGALVSHGAAAVPPP
jgi:GntR family transcriptional regulator/MocR family aminotransferase